MLAASACYRAARKMRPSALASLALSGCLYPNPAFDGGAGAGAGAGSGDTSTAPTTGASTDMSPGTATTTSGAATDSAATAASTGQPPPVGPTLCGAPFDPAAIQPGAAVVELSSPSYDLDMWLSADGLTIYFSSGREDADGDSYRATRPTRDQPFAPPINNVDLALNTDDGELKLALTDDGLRAALSTATTDSKIVTVERDDPGASFGPRTQLPLTHPLAFGFVDPHLSSGGDRLYASALLQNRQTLIVFGLPGDGTAPPLDPDPFVACNDLPGKLFDPSLSSDELVLLFGYRPDGPGDADIWYATRDALDAAFTAPAPLAALNTADDDMSPHVSADGCEIFFARSPAGAYTHDILRAAVAP